MACAKSRRLRSLVRIALCAALMAVCANLTVPSVIPFTMQTFGVFLALWILGGKRGTVAILLYLLLGSVGLPVFSGFRGGIGALVGATGGYLLGFLPMGLLFWLGEATTGRLVWGKILLLTAGLALCYGFGTAWFYFGYAEGASVSRLLLTCVVPFLLPDGIKLALAVFVGERLRKRLEEE